MVEGTNGTWYCSKGFPKSLQDTTIAQKDAYPLYRRRQRPCHINRHNQPINNSWIVPHNVWLTTKYDAHINVEICNSVKAVKYLYKYVHKGHDRAKVGLAKDSARDEITEFLDARYDLYIFLLQTQRDVKMIEIYSLSKCQCLL
jgi:hypothetical protein